VWYGIWESGHVGKDSSEPTAGSYRVAPMVSTIIIDDGP